MSGLRKKTIACLVCALLVCLMTLLFVNLNFLTARAYTTGEQTAGGVTWKTSGEEGAVWTIGEDGSGVLTTQSYAQEDAIDNTFAVRPTMADEAFGERVGKRHRIATVSGKSASVAYGAAKMNSICFLEEKHHHEP